MAVETMLDFFRSKRGDHPVVQAMSDMAVLLRQNADWANSANELYNRMGSNRPSFAESAQFAFDIFRGGGEI